MAASGMIDPTKRAKYPVVLSDALLGKASKETYTGIRYNHKPELSSETAPSTARIKQSTADEGTFNLGFDDKGNKYTYNGVRTTKDGNYVLIFDPAREVFVLHRLDSLFHMNLTRTPDNSDVDSIRKQFPQLEVQPPASGKAAGSKGEIKENVKAGSKETGTTKKPPAKNTKVSSALRKNTTNKQSQQQKKSAGTTALPETKKLMPPPPVPSTTTTTTPSSSRKNPSASSSSKANSKPTSEAASTSNKKRSKSPQSDEEDDDDDDGLILEFPGGPPPRTVPKYVPPATINRRFSDLYKNGDDDDADDEEANNRADASFQDADADGEDDDDDMDISFSFKTDSNSQQEQQHNVGLGLGGNGSEEPQAEVTQGGGDAAFDEADLEAEFQKDFDSESSVSEED